ESRPDPIVGTLAAPSSRQVPEGGHRGFPASTTGTGSDRVHRGDPPGPDPPSPTGRHPARGPSGGTVGSVPRRAGGRHRPPARPAGDPRRPPPRTPGPADPGPRAWRRIRPAGRSPAAFRSEPRVETPAVVSQVAYPPRRFVPKKDATPIRAPLDGSSR